MKSQTLIAVRDVAASSRWYQTLLDCRSGHGGPEYEQLMRGDDMFMQLHAWHAHDHPNLGDPDAAPHGYGVLLWFQVDEFDAAVARARKLQADILEGPKLNLRAQHREIWLRDPDGYVVVLASAYGDVE
ncbi:protein containing glyoxalase/bleomycin resistance protein/dioxygenase superfamily domain [Hahella chejuensis KCTC 2396]|uniref:Protein containing glyoxalase/bleomycin resistance protein/dioxygenase superfamily domain n=1 Tax=Hahella chejuensis (strain KCTC 2396) TaxID=349521 RepID=Q2SG89_HAHCH|nr:VOC family protein [Hahella chejuensis]ABC30335.1 protein containing glyoxalase/bleomycin resistance protein/dioxygenase superfamily domain [Hahella chejuensis KCTC 2396]